MTFFFYVPGCHRLQPHYASLHRPCPLCPCSSHHLQQHHENHRTNGLFSIYCRLAANNSINDNIYAVTCGRCIESSQVESWTWRRKVISRLHHHSKCCYKWPLIRLVIFSLTVLENSPSVISTFFVFLWLRVFLQKGAKTATNWLRNNFNLID